MSRRRFTVWIDAEPTTAEQCMRTLLALGPELKAGIVVRRDGEEDMFHLYLPEPPPSSEDKPTPRMEQLGWIHPSYSKRIILGDQEKATLEDRSPTDTTYKTGFIAVYVLTSGEAGSDG